jgi:nucleotide-binding universal stress UspA family protein
MLNFFRRTTLSDRQEAAVRKTLQHLRQQRKSRFRILACVDGLDENYTTVRWAARLAVTHDCDIIVVYVRPIDQGLHSGGLQVRLARQNMMDAGFELPGVGILKRALAVLKEEGVDAESWEHEGTSEKAWGDAAGDTKVEYHNADDGRSVVLKLKIAPDVANGILDQYELGPYNLIIVGDAAKWRSEFKAFFGAGIAQTVANTAPCSVLLARNSMNKKGYLIHTDGKSRSLQAVRRAAVLAHVTGEPVSLLTVSPTVELKPAAEEALNNAVALLKAMKIDVVEAKVAVGNTVEEIVETGALYKVVAVKDEGRSRFQRLFKGSVASEVIKRSRTSVLEIR